MVSISPPAYALPTDCPVKWTATQEKSINRDYPHIDSIDETSREYASRTYFQFLWLPESIMPLNHLIPALRRIITESPLPASCTHPLHDIMSPLLLTPRGAVDKYHSRVPQLLADGESAAGDAEEAMMWFALRHERSVDDMDEEQWKTSWLERMERREVQIQIILHMLLLTVPGPRQSTPEIGASLPDHLSPKKRKRTERKRDSLPPIPTLEEHLESFMDKLSMWQLMSSLEGFVGGTGSHPNRRNGEGREMPRLSDERDWIQVFCEDVIQPLFKDALPQQYALFRSKVFHDSPFSDSSDSLDVPTSPPHSSKYKRTKLSTSSRQSSYASTSNLRLPNKNRKRVQDEERSRSRSLSVSLEEERANSLSTSIGPANMRKRALVREVSMSTVFKDKDKEREKTADRGKGRTGTAQKQAQEQTEERERLKIKSSGVTLVAATPVKSKTKTQTMAQFRSQQMQASDFRAASSYASSRPSRSQSPILGTTEDDEDEDEEWMLHGSPNILRLSSGDHDWDDDDDGNDGGLEGTANSGHVLVAGTPTKARGGHMGMR